VVQGEADWVDLAADEHGSMWLAPLSAAAILAIRTTTGAIAKHDTWPAGFTKGNSAFYDIAYDGNGKMWLAPYDAAAVLSIVTTITFRSFFTSFSLNKHNFTIIYLLSVSKSA
jgi:hypothetical protein